tara:strand:+ start:189 stop:404 length:216 start_codon:yes stop_codon:yes gene_type:complete
MANYSALNLDQLKIARHETYDKVWRSVNMQNQMTTAEGRVRVLSELHAAVETLYWIIRELEDRLAKSEAAS